MIQSYANKLTLFLMKSETIDKEEEEIYQYGFEVKLERVPRRMLPVCFSSPCLALLAGCATITGH